MGARYPWNSLVVLGGRDVYLLALGRDLCFCTRHLNVLDCLQLFEVSD